MPGLRDLWLHPAVRGRHAPPGTKTNRALVADYGNNRAAYANAYTNPKFRDYESYERAYKLAWVRACVQVVAYNAAATPFRLVDPGGSTENDDTEVTASPFLNLLTKPNPYQTGFELREAWWTDLELTGNAFLALEAPNANGLPTEMWRLRPSRVTILPDPYKYVAGYRYTAYGRTVEYGPDEIIHLKYANPLDDYYGMGVIEAGEARFESEMAMAEHERGFWGSGAKIMGIFGTDETLDQNTFERIRDTIRNFFLGSGYSTLLMEQGIKYQSVSDSPAKLGMLDMAKASRDQILALFGVPATKLGILEKANYKADEADRFFWSETIAPKLTRIEESLQPLVEIFHPGTNYRLRWKRLEYTDDLPQMQVAKTMSEAGTFTVDEIRAYTGRDPLKDGRGSVVLAQITTVPLDLGGAMATVNERRADQSLPPLEGGNTTIILPRGSVPLDVQINEIEAPMARQPRPTADNAPGNPPDSPVDNPPAGGTVQPSAVSNVHRAAPRANRANVAPTTGPNPPAPRSRKAGDTPQNPFAVYAPATYHLVTMRLRNAMTDGMARIGAVDGYFVGQAARIKAALAAYPRKAKAALTLDSIWDTEAEDAALKAALGGIWQPAIADGYVTAARVGYPAAQDGTLAATLSTVTGGINNTTRKALEAVIAEGLRRSYSIEQIYDGVPTEKYLGIHNTYLDFRGSRAATITHTETLRAYNAATLAAYAAAGVPNVAATDGSGDPDCAARDGIVVPISEAPSYEDHPNGTLAWLPLTS